MKIRMRNISAGPEGVRHPGQVCDVSPAEAKELIAGKYAEEYKGESESPESAAKTNQKGGPQKKK